MFDTDLEQSLEKAHQNAWQQQHEYVTTEHLLLALLSNSSALIALRTCGADIEYLRQALHDYISNNVNIPRIDRRPEQTESHLTAALHRVVQKTDKNAEESNGKKEATGADILLALIDEEDSFSAYSLGQQGIERPGLLGYLSRDAPKIARERSSPHEEPLESTQEENVSSFCTDLNEKARSGKIDCLIGREKETQHLIRILCRRIKNNPILIGEAGVGKTAIIEGLAQQIVSNNVPPVLSQATIYALDLGSLIAGTRYRGDFEKRLKNLLFWLQEKNDAVLFIDEIHSIVGTGNNPGIPDILKPVLATGLRCIGATTYREYRTIFEKDRALARRFLKIEVSEPSVEDTVKILEGLKERFAKYHDVRFTKSALQSAAKLSSQFITDRYLPDKAIDLMDEAAARLLTLPQSKRKKTIDASDIKRILERTARIPSFSVSDEEKKDLQYLEKSLKEVIFGQDGAIEKVSATIRIARSGLTQKNRPIGCFLFVGPTGVGKTELSRQLAKELQMNLVRFDMSEYMERHTVSALIGAPPGYVGYEQGGLLTDAIHQSPHSVLLLDEIEKAHPSIFNILLQVMDRGCLTDSNGRAVDFRHALLIMTSNAGAEQIGRSSVGFNAQDHSQEIAGVIAQLFSPEFRNRLDAAIYFSPLQQETAHHVARKFIAELEKQLREKQITLIVTAPVYAWLSNKGYDAIMGARPMHRLIEEELKKPLADEILFGKLAQGGKVQVDLKQEKLVYRITSTSSARSSARGKSIERS